MDSLPTSDFELFISYARKDNEGGWITRFIEELLAEHRLFAKNNPARELRPFFDQDAIGSLDDWQHATDADRISFPTGTTPVISHSVSRISAILAV